MEADQTACEEFLDAHSVPAIVVGVSDDESRENEKEIDGQVTVVDPLVEMARGEGFEKVEADDRDGGDAAQSVEDVVMGFGVGESCRGG